MVNGIDVDDIIKALPLEGRTELADMLKREGGVEVTFRIASKRRKQGHRLGAVKNRVVSLRLTEGQFEVVERRANGKGLSVGDYVKWLATRSHRKGDGKEKGGYNAKKSI